MKKNILFLILCANILNAQAQLKLQLDVSPRQADLIMRSIPSSEFEKYIQTYGVNRTREDGSISKTGLTAVTSQTEYKWKFKNTEFYSYVKAFRTNLTPPPSCDRSLPFKDYLGGADCSVAISSFRQCHLFLISTLRKLIAVQPLYIPQPDFIKAKPSCFDVYAMAPAKVVKDSMLIVAGYYDSRWTCDSGWYCASNSPAASPDPLYKTTFLIRFSQDDRGQLTLSQDEKCMPLLNKFDTIAKARRALKDNGCQ